MKETITIEIEAKNMSGSSPHYLNSSRTFKIHASRGRLFRSLEAIERKLLKLYPLPPQEPQELSAKKEI